MTFLALDAGRLKFAQEANELAVSVPSLASAAFAVGIVSGIYGIGGGALMAPICVAFFALPLHAVAGAALAATLVTSVAGVAAYSLLPAPDGVLTQPDWALGASFGAGGLAGTYLGARLQRHVPQRWLERLLALVVAAIALRYLSAWA